MRSKIAILVSLVILALSFHDYNYAANAPAAENVVNSGAAINGAGCSVQVPISAIGSLVEIGGGVNSSSGGNYYGFFSGSPINGAFYSVPSGQTLHVYQDCEVSSVASGVTLGVGTAGVPSEGGATGPSGKLFMGTGTLSGPWYMPTANTWFCHCTNLQLNQNQFPFWIPWSGTQSYGVRLSGYLTTP